MSEIQARHKFRRGLLEGHYRTAACAQRQHVQYGHAGSLPRRTQPGDYEKKKSNIQQTCFFFSLRSVSTSMPEPAEAAEAAREAAEAACSSFDPLPVNPAAFVRPPPPPPPPLLPPLRLPPPPPL